MQGHARDVWSIGETMPQGQQKERAEGRSYPWQLRSQAAASRNSQHPQTRVLHKSMKQRRKGTDPYG